MSEILNKYGIIGLNGQNLILHEDWKNNAVSVTLSHLTFQLIYDNGFLFGFKEFLQLFAKVKYRHRDYFTWGTEYYNFGIMISQEGVFFTTPFTVKYLMIKDSFYRMDIEEFENILIELDTLSSSRASADETILKEILDKIYYTLEEGNKTNFNVFISSKILIYEYMGHELAFNNVKNGVIQVLIYNRCLKKLISDEDAYSIDECFISDKLRFIRSLCRDKEGDNFSFRSVPLE